MLLLSSPFAESWLSQARHLAKDESVLSLRAAAWAAWAAPRLQEAGGQRTYPALLLDGSFYDTTAFPHLEFLSKTIESPDANFPLRLALSGTALGSKSWAKEEVLSLRRQMAKNQGDITPLAELLLDFEAPLRMYVLETLKLLKSNEAAVDLFLTSTEADQLLYRDFTTKAIAQLLPPAESMSLRIKTDTKFIQKVKNTSTKKNVFILEGAALEAFALCCITPRFSKNLTRVSFAKESLGALLVRALQVTAICEKLCGLTPAPLHPDPLRLRRGAYFRALAPNPGGKTPQASSTSAKNFIRLYPDAKDAYEALYAWAGTRRISVSKDQFYKAHRAFKFGNTDEKVINTLLPLLVLEEGGIVRATFSAPKADVRYG